MSPFRMLAIVSLCAGLQMACGDSTPTEIVSTDMARRTDLSAVAGQDLSMQSIPDMTSSGVADLNGFNADGGTCVGSPIGVGWLGCRGHGCAVCSEKIVGFPKYLTNHPYCASNSTCMASYFECNNGLCPEPTAADQ